MQVSLEKISNIECRLTIVIPANQVEDAYVKQINHFAKNAKIKGFRPGKVPLSYIEQRFGNEVRREAVSDVIQEALNKAIKEKNLQPVSQPQVVPKEIEPQKPLEFSASFEVLPEISEVRFSLDKIEKLLVNIDASDIDRAFTHLQKQHTVWTVVDRPAKEKDRIVIDYYPVFDGIPEKDKAAQQFPLELGSHIMIPGFEEGLLGAKAKDCRTLHLRFPDDFTLKEKAGKDVEFVIDVIQVYEADVPAIDEPFVKSLGIKSGKVDDLKTQIQQTLQQDRDRTISEKLKDQVFTRLLEQNSLDVPKALVDRLAKKIHDEIYQHQEHHHDDHSDEEMASFNEIAKKRVAVDLLISALAKQTKLKPDKERVRARVKEIASNYASPEEVAKWLSAERIGDIEAQVLEDQVMDKLLEGVEVIEKQMTYAELKGIQV